MYKHSLDININLIWGLVLLGVMIVLILVFHMHTVALTVSLLGFYLIYLILEILFIQKKVLLRNQG